MHQSTGSCAARCLAGPKIRRLPFAKRRSPRWCAVAAARGPTKMGGQIVIPGAFTYHRPASVAEAVGLLADLGEDARPLAGGHSLIPMMKLRLPKTRHPIHPP